MDDIQIDPTRKTPFVSLKQGNIQLSGRSIPEDPASFYRPIVEWMAKYSLKMVVPTKVDLKFEYINTASTKWIYSILKTLGETEDHQKKMEITWHYEVGDDDMYELGHILKKLVQSPFHFVETEETE